MPARVITDEVVDSCVEMLAHRWLKSHIKQRLKKRWAITCPSTIERALLRAREKIQANAKRPLSEVLAESIQFYERIIAAPDIHSTRRRFEPAPSKTKSRSKEVETEKTVTVVRGVTARDKIRAQRELNRLLGLGNEVLGGGDEKPILRRVVDRGTTEKADEHEGSDGGV